MARPATNLTEEFWQFAERYIALDTALPNGNAAIEPLLNELLAPLEPRWEIQRLVFRGQPNVNVCARFGPEPPGGLLLVTHSDTVPAGDPSRWTRGPAHQLTRDGEQVIGLGVADVKLDYLCKAFALRQLDLTKLQRPVRLLATYGEEVGLNGAKAFLGQLAEKDKPEWVLCGEPSELIPCHAHKGYAVVRVGIKPRKNQIVTGAKRFLLRAEGKAAHSSTPDLGVNAIELLCQRLLNDAAAELAVVAIAGGTSSNTVPASAEALLAGDRVPFVEAEVSSMTGDGYDLRPALIEMRRLWRLWQQLCRDLQPKTDDEFRPNQVVNNLGVLSSADGRLEVLFDARLLPEHSPAQLIADFRRAAVSEDFALDVAIDRDNPGMRTRKDGPLLSALASVLESLGLSGEAKAKPTSTEAGVFARAGCDAAVFGPGVSIGNAHTANEWNDIGQLDRAVGVYRGLIETLCF